MLQKNYKQHLQVKHPEQDPSDLSPHLQMRIESFLQPHTSQSQATASQQSRKRSHESDVSEVPVHELEVPVSTEQPSTQASRSAQAAAETKNDWSFG